MRALKMILPVVAAAVLAAPALAQFGPRGGGFGGPGMLIGNKSVQKELKLTDDQIKKIDENNKKLAPKRQEAGAAFKGGDQEKGGEILKEIATETEKFIKDTLNADQQKRLKQIQLQVARSRAFSEEDTAKALKLTDEQKSDIKKINDELGEAAREAFQGAFGDQEKMQEARKKIDNLNKEAMDKITKMLNTDQKAVWKELIGAPFQVQFEGPRGGGGGGFGKKGKKEKD